MNFLINLNNPKSFDNLNSNTLICNKLITANTINSNAFLSLHQFKAFPENIADINTISSLSAVPLKCRGGV